MASASSAQLAAGLLTGASAAGSFVNDQRSAGALVAQSDFDARLAALRAKDAIARGNIEANRVRAGTNLAIGRSRAALAASGVDVGSGSALDAQGQEARMGALDMQTIRNNAALEAWGITSQATLNTLAARNRASAIRAQSGETLATGAARTYGIFKRDSLPKRGVRGEDTTDPSGSGADGW